MRRPALALCLAGALACGAGSEAPPEEPVTLALVPAEADAIAAPAPAQPVPAFDVVAADADGDGDTDALVNWHHHGPFEWLENREGRLVSHRRLGIGPELYAEAASREKLIAREGTPGLHVWHDPDRGGRWRFVWRDPRQRYGGLRLVLETSLGFLLHEGLEEAEVRESGGGPAGDARLEVSLGPDVAERAFSVQTRRIAVRLSVEVEGGRGGRVPLRAGARLLMVPEGRVEFWKDDPHGVAWLDLRDRGIVDLFVSRGALGGELVPPHTPKHDRLFAGTGGSPRYRPVANGVPPDFGRSRRVEAVDLEGDGRLELWIGNLDTPNRLLVLDPDSGHYRDRGAALGLDTRGGAIATFLDIDGDARDDLVFIEDGRLDWLRNAHDGAGGFERRPGGGIGLALPEASSPPGVIDPARLRPVDLDRDGDLDLLLSGWGSGYETRIFLREGERFRDATEALGVARAAAGPVTLAADLDLDGFPELLQLGEQPVLWHNRRGEGFEIVPLPPRALPREVAGAALLDVDGDGARDVLAVGRGRRLLWNRTQHGNRALRVSLPASAIGAVVTALHADGSRQAQRFGSESSSAFSQSLQPLLFGVPPAVPVDALEVRWPGSDGPERVDLEGRSELRLSR